ncbi:MAG TPA: histidine ammonia-lyase [Trueperaceae bacterium]
MIDKGHGPDRRSPGRSGQEPVRVGGSLTLRDIVGVARSDRPVELAGEVVDRVKRSREFVDELVNSGKTIYGITTGFGHLARVHIEDEDVHALQRNLVLSHSAGVGEPFSRDVTRAMLLLRAQSLALGYSGVRLELLELLLACLNRGVHPVIPSQGSVGASGDLAPLAHMALTLIGEGEAEYRGEVVPAARALEEAGLRPLALEAKEGLALINGTQAMTSVAALVLHDALGLCTVADVAGAMSLVALRGLSDPFDPRVGFLRPHRGCEQTARNLRLLLAGSTGVSDEARVQDAYSLRCMPQVHGASRGALLHAADVVVREVHSVTDNPLIFEEDGDVISAGNFHGQPVALAMDYAKSAIAELASISERRIARLQDPALSNLPAFLTSEAGLNSGLMITQYTAAALVSENKVLAHPASVDSVPTSANQEDHVSMGTIAARQAAQVLTNSQRVLAIELLNAAQALDLRPGLHTGPGVTAAHHAIREVVPQLRGDRVMAGDLEAAFDLVARGTLLEAVAGAVEGLEIVETV